jgi:GrpB-like predicted nucleotidyltransferase (UPF0157 family)
MAGLDPAIYELPANCAGPWMPGSRPGMTIEVMRESSEWLRALTTIAQMCDWLEMAGPEIEIVLYRTQWRSQYAVLAALLYDALGDAVIAIHHIGSTAVPDLVAKDVIDIQLTIARLADCSHQKIEAAGFELGKPTTDHCLSGLTLPRQELAKRLYKYRHGAANLHVRERGRFNQRYPLLCRDYLRTHKMAAAAYGEIKQQLAKYFPNDPDAYYAIKDPTFDVLMAGPRNGRPVRIGENRSAIEPASDSTLLVKNR